jgi:regulator of protease activity HflC (stomatin/prohibitin superfamily)
MSQRVTDSARRLLNEQAGEHVPLGKWLRFIAWLIPMFFSVSAVAATLGFKSGGVIATIVAAVFWGVAVSGIRVTAQWERGVILRMGKYATTKGPGVIYVIPVLDYIRFVDLRVLTLNIPSQKVITKDNVPAEVDGALFFQVCDPCKAVTEIQNYQYGISQYAQASLRDVIGGLSLDELLTERERIQESIRRAIEERIKEWGVHVDSIRLLDIEMPEDLKRMMSRQASAEREKRATITKAEGDKLAAVNLSEAARLMSLSPGAMQLRTLQTIDGLGPTPSNTVVLFPAELAQAVTDISHAIGPHAKAEAPGAIEKR